MAPEAAPSVSDELFAHRPLLLDRGDLAGGLDGGHRRPLHVRHGGEGDDSRRTTSGQVCGLGWETRCVAIGACPIENYTDYIRAMRAPGTAGGPDDRRHVDGPRRRGDPDRPGAGRVSAAGDLSLVVGLVPPGDADLRRRGAGVLEAAARRLGAALLLALHRDSRRLHGGIPLDGDRRRAAADLSVRGVRDLRAGGQPPLLPGLPPAEPDLRGLPALGPGRAVWDPVGLSRRALGDHVLVAVAGAPRRRRLASSRRSDWSAAWRWATSGWRS